MAYRLHVGTFTGEADDVDDVSRGTFLGVLKKVPHLRKLGGYLRSLEVLDIISGMRSCLLCPSFSASVQCVLEWELRTSVVDTDNVGSTRITAWSVGNKF